MNNNRVKFAAAIAVLTGTLAGLAPSAKAAVVLSIGQVTVPAGSTALVGVFASSTTGDVISGFNLPTDINDDGFINNGSNASRLPAGFTLDAVSIRNPVYVNAGFDMPYPQIALINADGIATGSGNDLTLGVTPTLLFDLAVDVGSAVQAGTVVPLEIKVPADPFGSLFTVAGPNAPTVLAPSANAPVFGSITVTAVPEPTAACLTAAFAAAGLGRRSRRSR